jgi:hypothetical protein
MSDIVEDDEQAGRSPLVAAALRSRSVAAAYSSSRSRRATCTRRHAVVALASAVPTSLTRASSHCRRFSVSRYKAMVRFKAVAPIGGYDG